MRIIYLFFCMVCYLTSTHAQVISVVDFGAKPDSFEDAVVSLQQAIEKCKNTPGAVLMFPKGRYDFWPDKAMKREYFISNTSSESECSSKIKNIGLLFEEMSNLIIEGNGSLLVFHGKMITWAFDKCENMEIRNLSVDFERPSISEFTIEELDAEHIIASIHPDSKYAVIDGKIRFFGEGWGMNNNFFSIQTDTIHGTNLYSTFEPILNGKSTEIAPFRVKIESDFSQSNYVKGQTITTRSHIRDHVGVFVNQSKNVTLKNINMHYMHGLGIVSQFSENLNYTKVNIVPWRGRTIAAFADGMHFSGCKGHIEIEGCNIKGLHDDPINVHGTYLRINKINAPNIFTMRYQHAQTYGMQAFFEEDTVAFIKAETLQKIDYATVKSVKRLSDREIEITLSRGLPKGIGEGDCLENITCTPSLRIAHCRFEMTNTRGVLISTPRKVVVENNYFYRTGMYAILIAGDANSWFESGAVNDVLIRNNIFDACAYNMYYDNNSYVISIEPENHERVNKHWVHRSIRIEGNEFNVYKDNLILKAKSTQNLYFGKNQIRNTTFIPIQKGRVKSTSRRPAFILEDCSGVIIVGNKYGLDTSEVQVDCKYMKKKDIKIERGTSLILK